jgi:hypothetical protein
MSRSRKKVPGYSDSEGSKDKAYFIRLMNKRIRRLDPLDERNGMVNGKYYRKMIDRWDFNDYNFRYFSENDLKESWFGEVGIYKAIRK